MKKIIISILIICTTLCITGCNLFNNHGKDRTKLAGWTIDLNANMLNIPNDALVVYNKAIQDYTAMKVEPVAFLGTQIVSGKNYMYLCKATTGGPNGYTSYKVFIIYNDLEGNASVTSAKDFDIASYADKSIPINNEQVSGGWTVNTNMQGAKLKSEAKKAFNSAVSRVTDAKYTPIATLATQSKAGNNYAILALRTAGQSNTISVLTIYEQLDETSDISSTAYVNLSDFNK